MFCKKVNIPFEVYAFSTFTLLGKENTEKVQTPKIGDLVLNKFSLLNILSHKMSSNDFTKMSSYLLDFGTGRRGTCTNMEPPEIMELSGTPLNEAVISAFKLVPQFQKQNKLEIVSCVFLTDGEGSPLPGRYEDIDIDNPNRYECSSVDSHFRMRSFLRDTTTKATSEILERSGYASRGAAQTTALLKLLKTRTESNVIGFYVSKVREVRSALTMYSPKSEEHKIEGKVAEFRKNNFTYLNNVGYDEYYFLRSDKLDTDEDDEFEVTTTTTRGLVSAFSKYRGNRVTNRVVLNRFINLIA
jgi:hypothetical protein